MIKRKDRYIIIFQEWARRFALDPDYFETYINPKNQMSSENIEDWAEYFVKLEDELFPNLQ